MRGVQSLNGWNMFQETIGFTPTVGFNLSLNIGFPGGFPFNKCRCRCHRHESYMPRFSKLHNGMQWPSITKAQSWNIVPYLGYSWLHSLHIQYSAFFVFVSQLKKKLMHTPFLEKPILYISIFCLPPPKKCGEPNLGMDQNCCTNGPMHLVIVSSCLELTGIDHTLCVISFTHTHILLGFW